MKDFPRVLSLLTAICAWLALAAGVRAQPVVIDGSRTNQMIEGFGVHSFRLLNEAGESTFVKFHWRPKLGIQSTVWDEALKLQSADNDFHRRDLFEAIQRGDFPEWELAVQLFTEEELWTELERPDDQRRQSAVVVMDVLCNLAQIRAKVRGTSFLQERRTIFDVDRMLAEMRIHDGELHEAASRAWIEVCKLVAIRDAENMPSTEEDRRWAEQVVATVHAKVDEWRRKHPPAEEGK